MSNLINSQFKSIHQLFEEQVERTPDAIAVTLENRQLTYWELNCRANQLAHHLRNLGVKSEELVGICVDRSLEMLVGILGILKAGAAYIPLDPNSPKERLAFILQDSQTQIILTHQHLVKEFFRIDEVKLVCLDSDWKLFANECKENLISRVATQNSAYVIYTSGSTGKPKGVLVSHYNVVRLFLETQSWYQFDEYDVWTLFHSYAFDFSVWEIWGALLHGGRLVVVPYLISRSPEAFYNLICEEKVTVLNQTPSAFRQLIWAEESGDIDKKHCLRLIIFGGEALEPQTLKPWFTRHGDKEPQLVNMYGITETTVHVTYRPLTIDDLNQEKRSIIGIPIPDMQIYILDQDRQPLPTGVSGEMYISGAGVSKGYINRPQLNIERFIPNSFNDNSEAYLYKTGDLARYLSNGELEYLGRIDDQVKIRGFRIELGEIESVLAKHSAVQESITLVQEEKDGNKRLVTYVVPNEKSAFTVRQLLRFEKANLVGKHSRYLLPNEMEIFHLNKNETDFVYKEIFDDSQYLKHGITINEGDCIFDVGANIGLFSLFVSQTCKNTKIFAFEPVPAVFDILKLNIALYGLNAKVLNYGISNTAKSEQITYYPHNSVLSGCFANATEEQAVVKTFLLNKQQRENASDVKKLSNGKIDELATKLFTSEVLNCTFKTLSSVIRDNNIEKIDLLKIDAEKSELNVLYGINEEDWSKIKQVIVEVHDIDGQLKVVTEMLINRGFDIAIEQESLLENTGLYNVYAISQSSKKETSRETYSRKCNALKQKWNSPHFLVENLRVFLKQKLPEYMMPSSFVLLDSLPLTLNGKIDSRLLLSSDNILSSELKSNFVAPSSSIEQKVADIWIQVLNLKQIGIHDNFLELGGYSLLATQIIYRLRQTFEIDLPLHIFFEASSVALLSNYIEKQICFTTQK